MPATVYTVALTLVPAVRLLDRHAFSTAACYGTWNDDALPDLELGSLLTATRTSFTRELPFPSPDPFPTPEWMGANSHAGKVSVANKPTDLDSPLRSVGLGLSSRSDGLKGFT
jgi:hypothetical protein